MERKAIEAKKERYRLRAVGDLTRGVSRERELEASLRYALHSIMGALSVTRGFICTLNGGNVEVVVSRGVSVEGDAIEFDDELISFFGRRESPFSYSSKKISDSAREKLSRVSQMLGRDMVISPLKTGRMFVGVIFLGEKIDGTPLGKKDQELLSVMSRFLAAEINSRMIVEEVTRLNEILSEKVKENEKLISSLRSVYFQTIMALATAIDAKDPYTRGHSERVARISKAIAVELSLPEEEVSAIYMAGILHDIGKISTGKEILSKKGRLTAEEIKHVRKHPEVSYRILSKVKFPHPRIPEFALFHHEWYGGGGYPRGFRGEEIPLGARIIALADAFDAMVTDRPYRSGKALSDAISEIISYTGTQFDPLVVKAFLRSISKECSASDRRKRILSCLPAERIDDAAVHRIKKYLEKLD